jgi:hypothetical protein
MRPFVAALGIMAMVSVAIPVQSRAQELDQPIIGGRFYTQGSGKANLGYGVVDDANAPMFTTYQSFGGPAVLGYPISRRFTYNGAITQVFQRHVLSAQPDGVQLVATFDLLSASGKDGWLNDTYGIPPVEDLSSGDPAAALDDSPTIKATYYGAQQDPVVLYGLPTSHVHLTSAGSTLRTQRLAFADQDGTVAILEAGSIARDSGIFAVEAFIPQTLAQAAAPADSTGGSSGGSTPTSSTAPSGELKITAIPATTRPIADTPTRVNVRVTDSVGRPIVGAAIIVILHYPLKDENSAYAVDGVYFGKQTDDSGNSYADFKVDPAVPSGTLCSLEVSAVYPPTGGRTEVDIFVG